MNVDMAYAKGTGAITSMDFCFHRLRGCELLEDSSPDSEPMEGATAAVNTRAQYTPPEVTEMFLVNGNTQDFFKPQGFS